jgi:hypothetical protein
VLATLYDAFSSREPVFTSFENAIVKPNADELINLMKARKGWAHAPKHIKFVSELPMIGVGKVEGAEGRLLGRPRAAGG